MARRWRLLLRGGLLAFLARRAREALSRGAAAKGESGARRPTRLACSPGEAGLELGGGAGRLESGKACAQAAGAVKLLLPPPRLLLTVRSGTTVPLSLGERRGRGRERERQSDRARAGEKAHL